MKLKRGTLLQGGKYMIEQSLGQGSFGITYLATAKFSTDGSLGKMDVTAKVAIKEFFMGDINGRREDGAAVAGSSGSIFTSYKKRFRKEAETLAKLSHPNIVRVFDVFDENNTTYYVMEYLGDISLNTYIKRKGGLSETECINLTEGIGLALQYMHHSRMLHLDLKPGNIMLRESRPVLIDFGLAKQFASDGQPETSTMIGQGTPGYAPLEQQHYNGDHSTGLPLTMDVYGLGGTMFKMVTARTPPNASALFSDGFPRYELSELHISEHLINVIERAMAPVKSDRYQTVTELLSAIATAEPQPVSDIHATGETAEFLDASLPYVSPENTPSDPIPHNTVSFGTAEGSPGKENSRPVWIVAHLIFVALMLASFLSEKVYQGSSTPDGYPDTYHQIIMQALDSGEVMKPLGSILALAIGMYILLRVTWNKKICSVAAVFNPLCGAILIAASSCLCDLYGSCDYGNMVWIVFLVLSVVSSWLISFIPSITGIKK